MGLGFEPCLPAHLLAAAPLPVLRGAAPSPSGPGRRPTTVPRHGPGRCPDSGSRPDGPGPSSCDSDKAAKVGTGAAD